MCVCLPSYWGGVLARCCPSPEIFLKFWLKWAIFGSIFLHSGKGKGIASAPLIYATSQFDKCGCHSAEGKFGHLRSSEQNASGCI